MAISTRLRYEVLRRDLFTCRYCGARAPGAALEADHVTPRHLGGLDVLENLVAACGPCNNGKSASAPDPWLVAEVEDSAREWRGEEPDDGEDDYTEMYAYQDALYALEALTAGEVLSYLAKAYGAALPYRLTHPEAVRCAGMMAQRDAREAGAQT